MLCRVEEPARSRPAIGCSVEPLPAADDIVDLLGDELDPGGGQRGLALGARELDQLVGVWALARRSHRRRWPRLPSSLACLKRMMSGARHRAEVRGAERVRDLLGQLVDPARVAPDVDHARARGSRTPGRCRARDARSGTSRPRRTRSANSRSAIRSFSTPFCRHTTGRARRRGRLQRLERAGRVLALGREHHDLVAAPLDPARAIGNRYLEMRRGHGEAARA